MTDLSTDATARPAEYTAAPHRVSREMSAPELDCDLLAGGGPVGRIRAIRADDSGRLIEFHRRLSPETVYRRFFSPHLQLSPAEVERFTQVDYQDRLALVVEQGDELIAIARYERVLGTDAAEVAFVVADAHQGRGLGTLLLEHLAAAARPRGIRRFVAETLVTNTAMLDVFDHAGFLVTQTYDCGTVRLSFPI